MLFDTVLLISFPPRFKLLWTIWIPKNYQSLQWQLDILFNSHRIKGWILNVHSSKHNLIFSTFYEAVYNVFVNHIAFILCSLTHHVIVISINLIDGEKNLEKSLDCKSTSFLPKYVDLQGCHRGSVYYNNNFFNYFLNPMFKYLQPTTTVQVLVP